MFWAAVWLVIISRCGYAATRMTASWRIWKLSNRFWSNWQPLRVHAYGRKPQQASSRSKAASTLGEWVTIACTFFARGVSCSMWTTAVSPVKTTKEKKTKLERRRRRKSINPSDMSDERHSSAKTWPFETLGSLMDALMSVLFSLLAIVGGRVVAIFVSVPTLCFTRPYPTWKTAESVEAEKRANIERREGFPFD